MINKINWLEITDVDQLNSIKYQWECLNQTQSNFQIFNNTHWIFSWLDTFWQPHWYLKVLTAWQDQQLIAIVPMYYQKETFFSLTTFYPLGQGETEEKEISSEYLDVLIHPKYKSATISYIANWINHLTCDRLQWQALNEKSTFLELLIATKKKINTNEATRYLVNSKNWDISQLSKNMRSRYRRGLNQLTKVSGKIDWIKKDDYEQYWTIMKKFHQQRWIDKAKLGAFYSEEFNLFHKNFRQHSPDNVAMSAIWVNDAPIAIHYYLLDATTLYFYQSGWNERDYSNMSPGLTLHLWGIEQNTKPFYDFMMGKKDDSYKAKFSSLQQPMYNITIDFNPKKILFHQILKKLKLAN